MTDDLDQTLLAALRSLSGRLDRVEAQVGARPNPPAPAAGDRPPGPYVWAGLSAETAAELWADLTGFVDWLNGRYQLSVLTAVPGCWYLHGAAVEELTALRAAWLAAYTPAAPATAGPSEWHARHLRGFLDRLHGPGGWFTGCTAGHQQPDPPVRRQPAVTFDAHVAADLAGRD